MPEETYSAYPSEPYYYETGNPRPELSPKPIDKRPIIYGIVAAVVIILVFGGIGVGLYLNPPVASVLRDIFIIFLGLGAFVIILLLIALVVITIYLVLKINDLVRLLEREIKPLLVQVQETTRTVKGTTTFLSDQAVKPVIATASTIAATRAIFKSLFQR